MLRVNAVLNCREKSIISDCTDELSAPRAAILLEGAPCFCGVFEELKFDAGSVVQPAVLEAGSPRNSVHES